MDEGLLSRLREKLNDYIEKKEEIIKLEKEKKELDKQIKDKTKAYSLIQQEYLDALQMMACDKKVSVIELAREVLKVRRTKNKKDKKPTKNYKNIKITQMTCYSVATQITNSGVFKAHYNPDGRRIRWAKSGINHQLERENELIIQLEERYSKGEWNGKILLDIRMQCDDDKISLVVPFNMFERLKNGLQLINYLDYITIGFYPNFKGIKQSDYKINFSMGFKGISDLCVNLYDCEISDGGIGRLWVSDADIEQACVNVLNSKE